MYRRKDQDDFVDLCDGVHLESKKKEKGSRTIESFTVTEDGLCVHMVDTRDLEFFLVFTVSLKDDRDAGPTVLTTTLLSGSEDLGDLDRLCEGIRVSETAVDMVSITLDLRGGAATLTIPKDLIRASTINKFAGQMCENAGA